MIGECLLFMSSIWTSGSASSLFDDPGAILFMMAVSCQIPSWVSLISKALFSFAVMKPREMKRSSSSSHSAQMAMTTTHWTWNREFFRFRASSSPSRAIELLGVPFPDGLPRQP